MRLTVELYGTRIGTLAGSTQDFDFVPSPQGIERFGVNSTMLSVAIPFTPTPRRDRALRRRNWFAEILPEGDQYDYMLAAAGLRDGDTPGFLAHYGRDVAGALQIWDPDDPTEPRTPGLRPLTDADVRALLEDPIATPLANAPQSGRSSIGGVQPKIVVVKTATGWAQALGGYPTTHILKPQLDGKRATIIFDEEYGSRIAHRIGLTDHPPVIANFDGHTALVIERYDRDGVARIHQEDFNQALGASRNEKYQEIGGVVTLKRIAGALTRYTSSSELRTLARMLVLAVGIGNLDLHAKNISLLHPVDAEVQLAPAYDIVPQAHTSSDGRLALSVNRRYRLADVTAEDIIAEIRSWGLRNPTPLVRETLAEILEAVTNEHPQDRAYPALQEEITAFVRNLIAGRPAKASSQTPPSVK
jgi:serine/threonine-protein kinase HipA